MNLQERTQIVQAALEKRGYMCEPTPTSEKDVDFFVTPRGGERFELKVLHRLYFAKKFCEAKPQLRIAFPDRNGRGPVCLYHHNEMLAEAEKLGKITHTAAWRNPGNYHYPTTPGWAYPLLLRFASDSDSVVPPVRSVRPARPVPSVSRVAPTMKTDDAVSAAFPRAAYKDLNARQRENYNFHKVAAILSDYGFNSMRLSDDWQFADFIAVHIDGETILRVQLKSALAIAKKYLGKNLHIAFPDGDGAYVFPHDKFVEEAEKQGKMTHTESWKKEDGLFQMSPTPKWAREWLAPYRLTPNPQE